MSNYEDAVISGDSLLSNYADYYEEWDDSEEEICGECYGTGMDRDELYECPNCAGEGVMFVIERKIPR